MATTQKLLKISVSSYATTHQQVRDLIAIAKVVAYFVISASGSTLQGFI